MDATLTHDKRATGAVWLAARLALGWFWLEAGIEKLTDPNGAWVGATAGSAVTGFLKGALTKTTGAHPEVGAWYATFIRDFALPNATAFSYLVTFGELLVGIALIVGLFTRFSAVMGLVMNFAFLFAGTSSTNPQAVLLAMPIAIAGAGAGYYGLDRFAMPYVKAAWARTTARPAVKAALADGFLAGALALTAAITYTMLAAEEWAILLGVAIAIGVLVPLAQHIARAAAARHAPRPR